MEGEPMEGEPMEGEPMEGEPMEGEPRFVGIDVSKAQVDVAVRPTGQRWVVSYDETGIKELVSQMVDLGPALVLLEATGGLELPLVAALAAAALPVVVDARFATSPGPPRWPRPIRSMRRCWPTSPTLRPSVRPLRDAQVLNSLTARAPGVDHAGLREEPAGYCQRRASPHRSPYRLVGTGVERFGQGVKAVSASKSSMAREGRPSAHRSRRGGAALSHPAGRPPRVGHSGPTADRGLGGRGALQPGQRHLARQTRRLGRTLPGSGCSLHGDADPTRFNPVISALDTFANCVLSTRRALRLIHHHQLQPRTTPLIDHR